MLTGISLATAASRLWIAYDSSKVTLNKDSVKVSSGTRLTGPSDNIVDYFRSQKLRWENRGYDTVGRGISEAVSFAHVAEAAGSAIFQKLADMTHIVSQYWDPQTSTDEKEPLAAAFSSTIDEIERAIDNARYDDLNLISDNGGTPLRRVSLDAVFPTTTLDISFNSSDIVDVAALRAIDISAPDKDTVMAAVEAQQQRGGSYLAKASGYVTSLESHYKLVQNKIQQNARFDDVISHDGEAKRYEQYIQASINNQTTIAMIAQSNMVVTGVLGLLRNNPVGK